MHLTIETLAEAAKEAVVGCCSPDDRTARELATEILTAIEQAGYVVVPREATEAMLIDGAARQNDFLSEQGPYPRTKAVWTGMIAAAPNIQHSGGE